MYMNKGETITVTLTLDSGEELECEVLTILEAGGQKYIALSPISGSGNDENPVYLYRFIERGDEEPELENITEDSEFDLASDAYNAWIEDQDFGTIDLDDLE